MSSHLPFVETLCWLCTFCFPASGRRRRYRRRRTMRQKSADSGRGATLFRNMTSPCRCRCGAHGAPLHRLPRVARQIQERRERGTTMPSRSFSPPERTAARAILTRNFEGILHGEPFGAMCVSMYKNSFVARKKVPLGVAVCCIFKTRCAHLCKAVGVGR